jgi:hypothetical protein
MNIAVVGFRLSAFEEDERCPACRVAQSGIRAADMLQLNRPQGSGQIALRAPQPDLVEPSHEMPSGRIPHQRHRRQPEDAHTDMSPYDGPCTSNRSDV